jgi:hypothetical protein
MMMMASLRERPLNGWDLRAPLRESSAEKMHAVPRKFLISPAEVKQLNGETGVV